ncbi:MAG: hypothetical protein WC809_18900 [Sinimarinibacterium sp.]|jgi:hypothetical protein
MSQLITQAEYARQRGCSREAVSKAIASGRVSGIPHEGRVMIDPAVADIQWARNTDVVQQQRGAPEQFANTQQRAQDAIGGEAKAPNVLTLIPGERKRESAPHRQNEESPRLIEAKADTELLRWELMQLELAEKRGELLPAEEVERVWSDLLAAASEAFDGIPDRLASKLAAETDPERCHALLAAEVRIAKARFAQGREGSAT